MNSSVLSALLLATFAVGGGAIQASSQNRALLTSRHSTRGNADEDEGSVRGSKKLVVNHLPKCGGLFARDVLGGGNVEHFNLEREQDSVTEADRKEFVVGMVRNPLDYYVSHWAFLSTGKFAVDNPPPHAYLQEHYPEVLTKCGKTGCGFTAGEKKAFNRFVRTVCTESIGQMSLRFWGSYVGSPRNGNFHNVPVVQDFVGSGAFGINETVMRQTILDDLDNVPSLSHVRVDCWVKQENLEADMFRCLQMYEKSPGHGKVDWQAIRDKIASNHTYENSSPHAYCKDLYDKDTLDMVVKADKHLFKLFGYGQHCPQ